MKRLANLGLTCASGGNGDNKCENKVYARGENTNRETQSSKAETGKPHEKSKSTEKAVADVKHSMASK